MKKKVTGRLALAGIMTALALTFLLLTTPPVSTLGFVALAGICGIPVVVELGRRAGLLHFVAVGLLAVLLVPAIEGKVLYWDFFGYYTVLKAWLEQKNLPRVGEYAIKVAVFLAALGGCGVGGYFLLSPALPDWFQWWMLPLAALLLTGVFLVYDRCLTGLVGLYQQRLQPHLKKHLHI